MKKKILVWMGIGLMLAVVMVVVVACAGASEVTTVAPKVTTLAPEVTTVVAQSESCATCHEGAGDKHQASYDELYQDAIAIADMAYEYSAPDTHIITFTMTKDGEPFDPADAGRIRMYFVPYTGTAFQYEPAAERLALYGDFTYDGAGGVTSTLTDSDPRYASSFADKDGAIMLYGYDVNTGTMPNSRVAQVNNPIGALLETGAGIDSVSAANNDGCEKCHSVPYLKHGYYYAQDNDDATTDFISCKACHLENTPGGHLDWQMLQDDPALAVLYSEDESVLTAAQEEQYAYTTSLMNDVHMSHAMGYFPYPQSMANCVTCHEGKLDVVLSAESFNMETCKSCHAVNGSEEYGTTELALNTIIPSTIHGSMDLDTSDCASCHGFSSIHSGYSEVVYTADGQKYSDAITVSIDSASISGKKLTIDFSATGKAGALDSADIVAEVLIGLYGYDTKDFIVNGHDRYDSSGNGVISRADGDLPKGAYEVGTEHAYFKTVSQATGAWTVEHDLSEWADMIDDGTIKRVEIGIQSILEDANGEEVALDIVTRTINLDDNAFDDGFYTDIVDIEKCENCHDVIGAPPHAVDRGGSIVGCRLCHVTLSGGSHMEMQSRSLDSYVHAVHSMQPFDIGDIDFADPVEEWSYEHHIGVPYPTHGITNCESCHNPGTYNVPDQSKSLPGLLSGSDYPLEGWDREIGDVPSYVTGPGARACGACHRAELINADDADGLASFNQHTDGGGYLVEDDDGVLETVIDTVMAIFK